MFPFRQVHHACFGGVSKYYTPFLVANQTLHFKKKEIREILPENNRGLEVVPQVLTNKAEEFLWAVRAIQEYGYREINLNLGCPSPMVVTRGRGAAMLADPDRLDRFFEEIFEQMEAHPEEYPAQISVKTRTGMDEHMPEQLIRVFNRYPFCELIIHPRRRLDQYHGAPDLDVFETMMKESRAPVCYNGDINTAEDYRKLTERFPDLQAVMIGRGLIRDPMLAERIVRMTGAGAWGAEGQSKEISDTVPEAFAGSEKSRLWSYQQELCHRYGEAITGERDVVAKMKEVWGFMADLFPDNKKGLKQIRKAKTYEQYEAGVKMIMKSEAD